MTNPPWSEALIIVLLSLDLDVTRSEEEGWYAFLYKSFSLRCGRCRIKLILPLIAVVLSEAVYCLLCSLHHISFLIHHNGRCCLANWLKLVKGVVPVLLAISHCVDVLTTIWSVDDVLVSISTLAI